MATRRSQPANPTPETGPPDPEDPDARTAATLTYNEARAALDLILAELQSSTLDVEAMAQLHRRAQAYARRCEQILEQVEQEILIWDPEGDADPTTYSP